VESDHQEWNHDHKGPESMNPDAGRESDGQGQDHGQGEK